MKRITALTLILAVLMSAAGAVTFQEFVRKAFLQSDAKRDAELADRYDKWDLYDKFSMMIPRLDLTMNLPTYTKITDEIEGFDLEYENEYEYYAAIVELEQQLPTNTEISVSMTYADYSKYREYGQENADGYRAADISVSLKQYLWGSNKGYHDMKRWLNARAERNINMNRHKLDILREAYIRYISYLRAEREYELNKGQSERYRDIFQATENSYRMGLVDVINYNRIKKRFMFLDVAFRDSETNLQKEKNLIRSFINEDIPRFEKDVKIIDKSAFDSAAPKQENTRLNLELDNAYRDYKALKSSYEPKVYGFLQSTYEGEGDGSIENMDRTRFTAGIGVNIPLANLSKVSKLKKEKISYLMKLNSYNDDIETVAEDFDKLLSEMDSDFIKIELYKQIIPSLKQNYGASISRFTIGAISLQELMDIEDEYITAEMEYLGVIMDYNIKALDASAYAGNIDIILEGLL